MVCDARRRRVRNLCCGWRPFLVRGASDGYACSLQVPACHSRAPSLCHGVREVRLWPALSVDFQIYTPAELASHQH